ncbi:hypothetical protein FB451DRAFT_1186521 [Mycena latifolia]|nr:hypothetical protein FB451DRAFT_1186521 [Mycena latifolia]
MEASSPTLEVPNIDALVHIRERARWESAQGCEWEGNDKRGQFAGGGESAFQLTQLSVKMELKRRSMTRDPKAKDEVIGADPRGPERGTEGGSIGLQECGLSLIIWDTSSPKFHRERVVISYRSNRDGQLDTKRFPITQMKTLTTAKWGNRKVFEPHWPDAGRLTTDIVQVLAVWRESIFASGHDSPP